MLDTAIREYKAGSRPTEPGWSADLVLLAKANLTIPAEQIDAPVQKTIKSNKADFFLAELTRIMALAPGQYNEQVKLAATSQPGLWMSKGDDKGVFWSENHHLYGIVAQ